MVRHGKTDGSGRIRVESNESQVKTGHFRRVKNGFMSNLLQVRLTCIFHMNSFIFYFYKENNMYLPFGKL